ncbi:MAG: SDR family NAD(P)-dependent oxidoreductase [Rickettsiales bacterium]
METEIQPTVNGRRTLLITGAGGSLGSGAVERALAEGWCVVAVLNRHPERKDELTHLLKRLKERYRDRLAVTSANFSDEADVQELFERHPEVDAVLHTAVAADFTREEASIKRAYADNVEAVRILARAAQSLAESKSSTISFHMVASDMTLQYEYDPASITHPVFPREIYAQHKFEAVHFLKDPSSGLKNLDISTSYPTQIQDITPSRPLISQMLRVAQTPDSGGNLPDMNAYCEQRKLYSPDVMKRRVEIVHRQNLINDILSCFEQSPSPGFREYKIQPDYIMSLGEMVRVVQEVIEAKRSSNPKEVMANIIGEQMELPLKVRALPTPPFAPPHQQYDFREMISQQYDVIAQEIVAIKQPCALRVDAQGHKEQRRPSH